MNGSSNGINGTSNGYHGSNNGSNGTSNGFHGTHNGFHGMSNGMNGTTNGINGYSNGTSHDMIEDFDEPLNLDVTSYVDGEILPQADIVIVGSGLSGAVLAER